MSSSCPNACAASKAGEAHAGLSPGAKSQLVPSSLRWPNWVASKWRGSELPAAAAAAWAEDPMAHAIIAEKLRQQRNLRAIALPLADGSHCSHYTDSPSVRGVFRFKAQCEVLGSTKLF